MIHSASQPCLLSPLPVNLPAIFDGGIVASSRERLNPYSMSLADFRVSGGTILLELDIVSGEVGGAGICDRWGEARRRVANDTRLCRRDFCAYAHVATAILERIDENDDVVWKS